MVARRRDQAHTACGSLNSDVALPSDVPFSMIFSLNAKSIGSMLHILVRNSQDTSPKTCGLFGQRPKRSQAVALCPVGFPTTPRSTVSGSRHFVKRQYPYFEKQVGTGVLDLRADRRSFYGFGTAKVSHGARVNGLRFAGSAAAEDSS